MKAMDGPWTQANALPGWGIVADLTPPELIASRRLRVVRRLMIVGLALVVVLCAGGYAFAIWDNGQAANGLTAEQDRTTTLIAQQRRYSGVTVARGAIADVSTQLAGLMAGDVNVGALVGSVVGALPQGMTIEQMDVTVSAPSAAGNSSSGSSGNGGGIAGLDRSSATQIGSITVSGTGHRLTDLAAYVAALRAAPGIFEPYPLSNQATETGTTYSLQLTLTDALLTHRFDVTGGSR